MDTESIWENVAGRLEAFLADWSNTGGPPDLRAFLPGPGDPSRLVTLVELIKLDMEERWNRSSPRRGLADYLRRFPELRTSDGIPAELLCEEIQLHRQHDATLDVQAFLANYSQEAPAVRQMLNIAGPEPSTSLRLRRPVINFCVGDRIDDFQLICFLGKGAFANVYLAQQQSLARLVALKISAARGCEAQTLARLDHPHIVRVYDQRTLPDGQLQLLYMQYIAGDTLAAVLRQMNIATGSERPGDAFLRALDERLQQQEMEPDSDSRQRARMLDLSWWECACLLGEQLAQALAYSHSHGVLHRDLKPANVLISRGALPMLVDFNVSYCAKADAGPDAYFGGSLAYMSPEQLEACHPGHPRTADQLDPRSDLFALGMIVWEMLSGRRPFEDKLPVSGWTALLEELLRQRRAGVATDRWGDLPPSIPPSVRATLQRALADDPDRRFASAAEMAAALRLCRFPTAQSLWAAPVQGWRAWVARWPVTIMVATVVLPHALASFLNYRFNLRTLDLATPAALAAFRNSMIVLNATAFPLGIGIGIAMMLGPAQLVRRRLKQPHREPAAGVDRYRCLRLGRRLAVLGIAEWCLAGIAFPIVMAMLQMPLGTVESVYFAGSLALCGTLGAVYPFFLASTMLLEVWYPSLVRPLAFSSDDQPLWDWLDGMSLRYLVLAAAVPLYSLAAIALRGLAAHLPITIVLSLGGLFLFTSAYVLWRRLQQNLDALRAVVRESP